MPRGRPPYQPTDKARGLVRGLALAGTTEESIARIVGIDPKTLRKYYRDELDLATAQACANVARALYETAIDRKAGVKHVTAAMFFLECKGGWRRKETLPPGAPDPAAPGGGGPQVVRIEFVGPAGGEELGSGPLEADVAAAPEPAAAA